MNALETEAFKLSAFLSASEDWSDEYSRTPDQHAELIKQEAKLELLLTRFYREMAKQADSFINWQHYNYQVTLDYNVDVIVNDEQLATWDGTFIKIVYKTVNDLIVTGMVASEELYKIPLGVPRTSALIQDLTTEHVAALVGKSVQPDGKIIDNPNTAYNIQETVRNDIASSVKTSLGLGETTDEAIDRIRTVISDKGRATTIAKTESVNAYQAGVTQYGRMTGAKGKIWRDAGAKDQCLDYANEGAVEFEHLYGGTLMGPTAHPHCKCSRRLLYGAEWDAIQSGNPYEVVTGITPIEDS